MYQTREKNPNWKGGRTITPDGYVLIRMPEHHRADVRGYVYEHILVAERKLGRPLRKGEIPHHKNEIRSDNRLRNIIVCPSVAYHRFLHRKKNSKLRKPGEPNPFVFCACDCGESFRYFDEENRPRKYKSGHNPQPNPAESAVLKILRECQSERSRIANRLTKSVRRIAVVLSKLKRKGRVRQISRGVWALVE